LIASFSTTLLLASVLAPQIQLADAGGKSPYDSGYDHGCDDAGISDPSDRYINEPGKGPRFHTNEFMQGYNAGYNACSGQSAGRDGTDDGDDGSSGGTISGGGPNWEQLCIRYHSQIGITEDRCNELADGTRLTSEGKDFLVCNLITRVGPTALGLDIAGIGIGGILSKFC
jgi:hypothetical protein